MRNGLGKRLWALASTLLIVGGLSFGASSGATASPAAANPGSYVVQAVGGASLDIELDGQLVRSAVPAKTVVGPLALTVGRHTITVRKSGSVLVRAGFTAPAGQGLDIVVHEAADNAGTPLVTVFRNDLTPVGPGKTRLVVSHVAMAPPADILINGTPFFRNVANGESLSLVVPAQRYAVKVVPTATSGPSILGPVHIALMSGSLTRVFAISGSAAGSADAIVQVIPAPVVGAKAPSMVRTGDGGQAADSFVVARSGIPSIVVAAGLVGLALLLVQFAFVRPVPASGSRHVR